MQEAIREYEKSLTEARTQRNLIQNQYNSAKKDAEEWDEVAEIAVEKGQDDNARQALERSETAHATKDRLATALQNMNGQIAKLEQSLSELKSRKEQVATEATLLEARTRAADAAIAINSTIQGVGDNNFGEMMDVARAKADEKEARANTLTEISVSAGDDLKTKIMGNKSSNTEDRLAKMKAERKKREEERNRRKDNDDDEVVINNPAMTTAIVSDSGSSSSHSSVSHSSHSDCGHSSSCDSSSSFY
jgi:phage shock protein A